MSQFGYSNGANSALNNYIDIQLYRQLLRDGYPVERALEIAAYQNSPQVNTSNVAPAEDAQDPAPVYQSVEYEDIPSTRDEHQSVYPLLSDETYDPTPQFNPNWPQNRHWLPDNGINPVVLRRRSPSIEEQIQHRIGPYLLPESAPQQIQPRPQPLAVTPSRPTSSLPAYTFTPILPSPGIGGLDNDHFTISSSPAPSSSSSSSPPTLPNTYAGRRGAAARAHFPFQCNICSKRYLFLNSIHKHWRAKHKGEWGEVPLMTVAEGAEKRPPQGEPRNKAAEEARKKKDGNGKGKQEKKEDDGDDQE